MKTGYRAAGDGNEQEGKQLPDQTGPEPSTNWVKAGILRSGANEDDADGQPDNRADLEEGGQVVARRQQQPDRQDGSNKAVADQHPGQLSPVKVNMAATRVPADLAADRWRSINKTKPITEISPIARAG